MLFISPDFHNTKAAPIQKALGPAPLFKTRTSKVIHPPAASPPPPPPPATPSCELQGGKKEKEKKWEGVKKARSKASARGAPQPSDPSPGGAGPPCNAQLLVFFLSATSHQARTRGRPQTPASANGTAAALPASRTWLRPPHVPAGHRDAGGDAESEDS